MIRLFIICSMLYSIPSNADNCKPIFCKVNECAPSKVKSLARGTLYFASATGVVWGGLELSKTLEQNQVIFASVIAGVIAYGFFNTLVTPILMPLQNKVQRTSFRMFYNSEQPTSIQHKRLHDFWRDNNTYFGPNESMGRNHYTATLGKAFHRMTYIHEQMEKGHYEYAIAVLKDFLTELKYYPEIFPHDKELQNNIKTHIIYLDPTIKAQARLTLDQLTERDSSFKEVSEWAKSYLDL